LRWSTVIVDEIDEMTWLRSVVVSIALLPNRVGASAAFEKTSTKLTSVVSWVARVDTSPDVWSRSPTHHTC
jgi:hypothetical protein